MHKLLKDLMITFDTDKDPINLIENCFATAVRATTDLFPNRFQPPKVKFNSNTIQTKQSIYQLRKNFESNPKATINNILPSTNPTSTPNMEDIINFYTRDRPPPIDESFCSDFPYCEDLDSFDPISIDELKTAFKIANKSAPGSDKLTYDDWSTIDPDHTFCGGPQRTKYGK